jgi:uncharacterized protein
VISDTHGLLRPEVLKVFRGVDLILHAGDIGDPEILKTLGSLARVIAVRGNNDRATWAKKIPESRTVEIDQIRIYLLHDLKEMTLSPSAEGFHGVVSGHSHKPVIENRGGVLFINPGSAGPRRFKLPISVARLTIKGQHVNAEICELLRPN